MSGRPFRAGEGKMSPEASDTFLARFRLGSGRHRRGAPDMPSSFSFSLPKPSQNYRIKINACIHRVECGTTAYFYTDGYTADKALIKAP